jgi:hypothetical protein
MVRINKDQIHLSLRKRLTFICSESGGMSQEQL